MPYINTIDVNGTIYNLGNLTNGTYMVDLPEDLRKNDILVLQGDIVDSVDNDNPPHNKPLSAYQGKSLNDKINTLSDNLNSEISSSVSDLSSKINEEIDRAKGAEKILTTNLSEEVTRATGVEGNLNTAIANEIKRATDTEAGLDTAIANEKDRADKAEKANAAAIKVITDDYLKSADKTALESAINTEKFRIDAFLAAADTGDKAIDTLKEIQNYIDIHGEAAAEMATNIGKNTTDIKALQDVVGTGSGDSTGLFKAIADAETSAKAYADDNFIKQTSIADNLSTNSSGQVLSAKQGKSLNEKKFDKAGGTITGDVTVNANITIGDNMHGIIVSKAPSADSDVANKKYVDDNIPNDIADGIVTKAKLAADTLSYINDCISLTEENGRSYIKMRNGVAILWGSFSMTVSFNTDADAGAGIGINYPEGLFISSPICTFNVHGDCAFYTYNRADGTIGLHRIGEAVSGVTIVVDYMAIGKYK